MYKLLLVALFVQPAYSAGGGNWGYPYNVTEWAAVNPVCQSGTSQSPIDFVSCANSKLTRPSLSPSYGNWSVNITNKGKGVQVDVPAGMGSFTSPTGTYDLVQCHWHDGSEHTVDGSQFDLTAHCVHTKRNSQPARYGVLGLFYSVGSTADSFLQSIEDIMPAKNGADHAATLDFQVLAQAANVTDYWTYPGSLTTPPCTEAVDWHVVMTPFSITQQQLDKFTTAIGWAQEGGTFRPPQALHQRTVEGCTASQTAATTTAAATTVVANATTVAANVTNASNTTTTTAAPQVDGAVSAGLGALALALVSSLW